MFAITPTTLKVFTLPKRADIEIAARHLQKLLNHPSKAPMFPSIAAKQQWLAQLERETTAAAATLSSLVLQPVAAELTTKRLLLVLDGILQYVPFAALPKPVGGNRWSVTGKNTTRPPTINHRPLIAEHEILTLPSASTMAVLRREREGRKPATKTLLVVADPVFSQDHERVTIANAAINVTPLEKQSTQALFRSITEVPVSDDTARALPRLPATNLEADAILALVPRAQRKAAVGFDATLATATSAELQDYRYVHFATHGLLNNAHPELSGLVLSLVNAQGHTQNGFLRAMDVFNLKLNAELLVLSGCQTALGKEVNGEGLIGLSRGFMYAGAQRVVASLWQVNDVATAELMKRFYQGLLGTEKLAPAAALRAAQMQMLATPRWRAPYYWAAFTLQGNW